MKCFIRLILPIISLLPIASVYAMSQECPDVAAEANNSIILADIIGLARDLDTGQPIYCEYYYSYEDNKTIVEYRNISQKLIVSKHLRYRDNSFQPAVLQKDHRHGELRQVLFHDDASEVISKNAIQVSYAEPNGNAIKTVQLPLSNSLIIDAGFDEAIRQYWSQLEAGNSIKLDFLSPVHLKAFKLSISVSSNPNCTIKSSKDGQSICFSIRPSNVFMSLFTQPLLLTYEKESKRLLMYSGSVNVTTIEGKAREAMIQYYYRDEV